MTRDEIRGLIGGYATGSLSAAERKALFEAALEDQELFDELAHEQSLKELLEEPGVKARLLEALAPRPKIWWRNVWVAAAASAFAVAVIAGVIFFERSPQRQEIAQVVTPAAIAPKAPALSPEQPGPQPVAAPAPVIRKLAAPIVPAPAATPAPEIVAPPAAAPLPLPAQAESVGALGVVSGVQAGVGGGGGGRGGAARAMAQRAAATPLRFAFDYNSTPEGGLRIVPASNGFLTVGSNNGTALSVLFNNRPLLAGAVIEIPLPADCVSALAIFSAQEMPPGFLNITSPLDPPSGTKSDPNPTPDSRLIAVVPVKR